MATTARRREDVELGVVRSRGPAPAPQPRSTAYSAAEILAAVRRWADRYGEPPTDLDWNPGRARRLGQQWRVERFEDDAWPSADMVRRRFASFNSAVEEAGFKPRSTPRRPRASLSDSSAVLEAVIQWTRLYGDVPTMADWDPTRAHRLGQDWRIARFHQGDWPSASIVRRRFGSFAAAISASGLVPRQPGMQRVDRAGERAANRLVTAQRGARTRDPGIEDLARTLSALALARRSVDPVSIHSALIDVASAALAWAEIASPED